MRNDALPAQYTVSMQVRAGQVIDLKGKLMQIQKYQHTQGSGRQLGNVQVGQQSKTRAGFCRLILSSQSVSTDRINCLMCSSSCGISRLAQSISSAAGQTYAARALHTHVVPICLCIRVVHSNDQYTKSEMWVPPL